jgi:hypothetical protein
MSAAYWSQWTYEEIMSMHGVEIDSYHYDDHNDSHDAYHYDDHADDREVEE